MQINPDSPLAKFLEEQSAKFKENPLHWVRNPPHDPWPIWRENYPATRCLTCGHVAHMTRMGCTECKGSEEGIEWGWVINDEEHSFKTFLEIRHHIESGRPAIFAEGTHCTLKDFDS